MGTSALSDAAMAAKTNVTDELWCNRVAAEVLVPLDILKGSYHGEANTEELDRLSRQFRVSTLVILKRIYDAQFLSWDEYQKRYDAERERLITLVDKRDSDGGNYYNTQQIRLGRRFARAVIASALEGSTTYRDAYRLLGTKKHSTFEHLAFELGVA